MYADLGPAALRISLTKQFRCAKQLEGDLLTYRMPGLLPPKNYRWSLKLWLKCYEKLFHYYLANEGKPFLIHAHSYLAGNLAAHLKTKYRIPYVLTEHSSRFIDSQFTNFQRKLITTAFDNASCLIAVSEGLKLKMQLFTQQRITVIPNMVSTELFSPPGIGQRIGLPFKFFFIGSLIDRKQPFLLLEAFAILKRSSHQQAELHFIGSGPLIQPLRERVVSSGLQSSVFMHGAKTPEETAKLLASGNVLVLPSKAETFGIVLIEAMACGLPVIASRCGGPEFIVDQSNGILIPPDNQKELEEALRKMYDQKQRYDPQLIRDKVLQKYRGPRIAGQIIKIYQSILANS